MTNTLTDSEFYRVLSCQRRRLAIEFLWDAAAPTSLATVADAVAAVESGVDPAPRAVRESVYTSLRQTHLPTLERYGLVADGDTGFHATPAAKRVVRRIRDTGPFGLRWSEQYRAIGVLGLCSVVAALAGIPLFGAVDPLLPAIVSLAAYAVTSAYHAWTLYPRGSRSPRGNTVEEEWQPTSA
ncbi:hypothetical protein B4589_005190 [Halolamina sp. CBA1230]|uniref:DUF7344 domain-containing protein n=1 Tax=Halolamina sp. CBA1230 TaxID=1853690 RepID=UPI0009A1466A|nr:hypothetical protein [Halolamina sp. CBA1230]QKY19802.1 hypothetical protein B4589_005190 [Halolamina sp. CBA1230]